MLSAERCDELARQWSLRPGVTYLNHGSFGPAPRSVLAARQAWFEQLESEPVDFFNRQLEPSLAAVRQRLGTVIGCSGDDLALVDNATVAMNCVARSIRLKRGDEVLVTDHEYGAVVRLWQQECDAAGARIVTAQLPEPLVSAEETADALVSAATSRTRLVVFSHVTSPTAVVLPAEAICRRARAAGLTVCIDGPHAVGMLPLDLARLDCDYYTASCHKWLSAPLGSGFLYVHPRNQASVRPAIVSWGKPMASGPSWRDEFVWQGTRDPSAVLSIPTALEFFADVGWEAFRAHTHGLAQVARRLVSEVTGHEPLVPDSREWYASMISLPLPAGSEPSLQTALWERYRIEIPLTPWKGRVWIRPSCHLYTRVEHLELLARALRELLKG